MSSISLLDLELITLFMAVVYRLDENVTPGKAYIIQAPKNIVTNKQYYKEVYLIHPSDETAFKDGLKAQGINIFMPFSQAVDIEQREIKRVMNARAVTPTS